MPKAVNESAPSKALEKSRNQNDIKDLISSDKFMSEVRKVLPKHITPERMSRVIITAILKSPDLQDVVNTTAGKASLLNACMICAQAGLEPDGRMAHLVPFNTKKGMIVQVIFDYKGLLTLAKRNGVSAKAVLVYSNDDFEYVEDDGEGKTKVTHRFNPFDERGELIGVYSRAVEDGCDPDYEFMSITEVESIRKRSRAGDAGPWQTDYGEMVKKCPIRRQSKRWDLVPEIREAINADDDTPPPLRGSVTVAPEFKSSEQPASNPEDDPDEREITWISGQIVKLMKRDKIGEGLLLQKLGEFGVVDKTTSCIEDAVRENTSGLGLVLKQWEDTVRRIRESEKEKEIEV